MGNAASILQVTDVAPSTTPQQITGFIDDATKMEASLPSVETPSLAVIKDSMESRLHTIVDVLSRPVEVARGTWAAEAQDALLVGLDFPQAIFDASNNVIDKLNFFTFFRADVCIRVMVNANTFQQGKLLGYFAPFEDLVGERLTAVSFLTSRTAYPYVINDASVGNTTDLLIPYVAPYTSYRLTDKIGNIGRFFLRVLNPLKSASTSSCGYTIYAWFTNISVDLPSGLNNTLTVNSELVTQFRRLLKDESNAKLSGRLERVITKFKAQVAGEAETKSSGVISATLHSLAQTGKLATGIPLLSSVAGPVSWAAKAAAHVAEYFGYSKAQDVSKLCRLAQIPGYGFTNASGLDSSTMLGSTQDNAIETRGDVFGSQVDDMEISAIVKRRCWVESFTMTTAQVAGTALTTFPVTPGWAKFSKGVYRPSLTAYVASMFNYWRGGLKFKIQSAKTAYHSGRVRIIYIPGTSTTVDDPEQAYNWIMDLRNQSEIEFTIPYNNLLNWQRCFLTAENGAATSTGSIRIEVLNVLRAPESVAQDIDFNIWISGDSTLQFAVPTFQRYVPSFEDPAPFKAQALGSTQDAGFNDMSDKPNMFETSHSDKIEPCKVSIGEMVTNLRYLTRRFSPAQEFIPDAGSLTLSLPNYYFGEIYKPTNVLANYRIVPLDYISYIYRFFRGGMRWKAMYSCPVTAGGYQDLVLEHGPAGPRVITELKATAANLYDALVLRTNTFFNRTFNTLNPVNEITAPYFSQTHIRPVLSSNAVQPTLMEDSNTIYRLKSFSSGSTESVTIFKAAADDFTFGWLIGPPFLRPKLGAGIALDLSDMTTAFFDDSLIGFEPIGVDGAVPNGIYSIISSDVAKLPVVFTTSSTPLTVQYDTVDFKFFNLIPPQLFRDGAPPATATGIDATATAALWGVLGVAMDGVIQVGLRLN